VDGEEAVWISATTSRDEMLLRLDKEEALELKAILGVLTDTANSEEEVTAGAGS
jgi:hypothetical protein